MLHEKLKSEVWFEFSGSRGPGGQNVNRNRTRATVCFMPKESSALNAMQKSMVCRKLANRINTEGVLQISAEDARTQGANKTLAYERLVELIKQATVRPKTRHKTKPKRSSVEKRLQQKKVRSGIKKMRNKNDYI